MHLLNIQAIIGISAFVIPFAFLFYCQNKIKRRIPFLFLSFVITFLIYYIFDVINGRIVIYIAKLMGIDMGNILNVASEPLAKLSLYAIFSTYFFGIMSIVATWLTLLKISNKYFKNKS